MLILQDEAIFYVEVGVPVCINDGKLAGFEDFVVLMANKLHSGERLTGVLNMNIE